MREEIKRKKDWRWRLHEIIFEADTRTGKLFDIILLIAIILSIIIVMIESVPYVSDNFRLSLYYIEWVFTILFTIEYILRVISVSRPRKYIFSFLGIIDLLAILPTYLSLFFVGTQAFIVIRSIRLLRVFRVLKLARFVGEASQLSNALKASRNKIIVFIIGVFTLVMILGTVMYLIEGPENGFHSIPQGVYWAIVTLTTVGYGDIVPHTAFGQALASFIMILGYGIIAIPTGIVTAEMSNRWPKKVSTQVCPHCSAEGHDIDAKFCKICGGHL